MSYQMEVWSTEESNIKEWLALAIKPKNILEIAALDTDFAVYVVENQHNSLGPYMLTLSLMTKL